jgi:predicted small lipoprotein YifL
MHRTLRFSTLALAVVFALAACGGTSSPPAEGDTATAVTPPQNDPREDVAEGADAGAQAVLAKLAVPARLEIALNGVEGLALVEYLAPGQKKGQGMVQLVGKITVSIKNPSGTPVRLVHMNPANLVFTRVDSGAQFSLLHPCDPGLLLGSTGEPVKVPAEGELRTEGNTVFTLAPGEARTLDMGDEWGCSGGPWKPVPAPGEYRVEYRIHRLADAWLAPEAKSGASIRDRLEAARIALASAAFWEGAYRSEPVPTTFIAPKVKRLGD